MTSYGYISMIIVDSFMIWFHFDCIMQLKKSHHIATNVCSRKSATTFGDLPDWKSKAKLLGRGKHIDFKGLSINGKYEIRVWLLNNLKTLP